MTFECSHGKSLKKLSGSKVRSLTSLMCLTKGPEKSRKPITSLVISYLSRKTFYCFLLLIFCIGLWITHSFVYETAKTKLLYMVTIVNQHSKIYYMDLSNIESGYQGPVLSLRLTFGYNKLNIFNFEQG